MGPQVTLLAMMVATLLMVVAGTSKRRLEWRPKPKPFRLRLRRRP